MRLEYPGKVPEKEIIERVDDADLSLRWNVSLGGVSTRTDSLYYGDNLSVLRHLLDDPEVAGKVRLVYIDPPFATGRAFATRDGRSAYNDYLTGHTFLEFLRQRLILLRELLADDGSIYVHIDSTIGHYVKVILDEVFGSSCFRSDISRIKCNPKNFSRKAYGNVKDTILFYSRKPATAVGDPLIFKDQRAALTDTELEKQFPKVDPRGRRYATTPLHAPGETRNGPTGMEWKGMKPPIGRHWRYPPQDLTRLDEAGLIEWSRTGNPRKIIYAEENNGRKVQDVWEYKDKGAERASYPTEKNIDLLKYIITNSSNEGDLVLDAFAGSGTTLVAANELRRSWIGMDASPLGISVCQTRLATLAKEKGASVGFSLYQANAVPEALTQHARMAYSLSGSDSLFPKDIALDVDLTEEVEDPDLGSVSAVFVDPDYKDEVPHFREVAHLDSGFKRGTRKPIETRFKIVLDATKIGNLLMVLALHETGKETLKMASRKHSVANYSDRDTL